MVYFLQNLSLIKVVCSPAVVNQTKPSEKAIEPNRIQSFDGSSIGSAIKHIRTQETINELELFGEFN